MPRYTVALARAENGRAWARSTTGGMLFGRLISRAIWDDALVGRARLRAGHDTFSAAVPLSLDPNKGCDCLAEKAAGGRHAGSMPVLKAQWQTCRSEVVREKAVPCCGKHAAPSAHPFTWVRL